MIHIDKDKLDLIETVRSILRIPKESVPPTTCPECEGTGRDEAHKWPDGSFAACEQCQGYGTINK